MKQTILSSTYFGPVQWYCKLNTYDKILLETCDNYIKQTYRNRCYISSPNGIQALSIPVERPDETPLTKIKMKDIQISSHGNWRHIHWNALVSAYGESPFFEFYADDIRPFFEKEWKYLLDYNMEICDKMCELLDIHPVIEKTSNFITDVTGMDDFRDAINPKHPAEDNDFEARAYYQVYRERYGFQPNLSILDLLCNMGPEGIFWLKSKNAENK